MRKLFITILLVFIYGICSASEYQQIDDSTFFLFTSDKEITLQWDVTNANGTEYDIYLRHYERNTVALSATIPHPTTGTTQQFKFKVPYSGHYIAWIRTVQTPLDSSWINSINSKTTMADLKALVLNQPDGPFVCDSFIWWNDNATLDQMKTKAKEQKGICSHYVNSTDETIAKVTLPDNTVVDRGWWLYGFIAPPTGGGVH